MDLDDLEFPNLFPIQPLELADQASSSFHSSVLRALRRFKLSRAERDELSVMLGSKAATERLLASNKRIRKQATMFLHSEFENLRLRSVANADRTFAHYSFLGPLVSEYRTELDIDAFRAVVDRLIRKEQLNSVFAIELQALTNYPQRGAGRSFLVNAHALAWSDEARFDHEAAARRMRGSKSLHSHFGAYSVVQTGRTTAAGELERLSYYLLKAPHAGKRRERNPDRPTQFRMVPVRGVRSDMHLRLAEILSQVEVSDLVHGVLAGKQLRSNWKRSITEWNKNQCAARRFPLQSDFDTAGLWCSLRQRPGNGSKRFEPVKFYGPMPAPTSREAMPRFNGQRLRPSQYRSWHDSMA